MNPCPTRMIILHIAAVLLAIFLLSVKPQELFCQSLDLPGNSSAVIIGDLDVPGNQITVEAMIYMDKNTMGGDIVSKHLNTYNVNYLLRPLTFELTTYLVGSSGATHFMQMVNPFTLALNKWYHVAGTYDGTRVKYYVNGCLVIDSAFSGNLYQNNYAAAIGNKSSCECEQFSGKIDEVRIWKTARSQQQIAENMLTLGNPASQQGLLAYYKFNGNYINSQGNTRWNGIRSGVPAFAPAEDAMLQSFEVTGIQTVNADCVKSSNGGITVLANQAGALYSLDGSKYQPGNQFSFLQTGNYTVYARNHDGCLIKNNVTVGNNHALVPLDITVSLCTQNSYAGHTAPGVYTDTLYAANSCDTLRTIHLTESLRSRVVINHSICKGESYLGYQTAGEYSDTLVAANGCDSIRTLKLAVLDAPDPVLGKDRSICKGDSIHLFPGKYDAYVWQDGSSADHFTVTHAGIYSVQASNACGTKQQQVVIADGNCGLIFPNAFTPNGDALNDQFKPKVYNLTNFQWRIYNRAGKVIFETKGTGNGWDGRINGQPQDAGVYVWTCSYIVDNKTEIKKGTLVLIR